MAEHTHLFQKLNEQRKEQEARLAEWLAEAESPKRKNYAARPDPIQVFIKSDCSGDGSSRPHRIQAPHRYAMMAFVASEATHAATAHIRAAKELREGRIQEFHHYFALSERYFGGALAVRAVDSFNRVVARGKAQKSHAKRRNLKKERVLDIYRSEISPKLSASRAAEIIFERYSDIGCSERTAAKWISAERKKVATRSNHTSPSD